MAGNLTLRAGQRTENHSHEAEDRGQAYCWKPDFHTISMPTSTQERKLKIDIVAEQYAGPVWQQRIEPS